MVQPDQTDPGTARPGLQLPCDLGQFALATGGHPDLSGPWVGGGSNADIEKEGGLKPGELPLLPAAKALRDSRKDPDEPYLYCTPMGVPRMNPYPWKFVQSVTAAL